MSNSPKWLVSLIGHHVFISHQWLLLNALTSVVKIFIIVDSIQI